MDKIKDLRNQIDMLDDELMKLLSKRYDISEQIGEIKSNSKKEVLDLKREDYVLNKAKKHNHSQQLELVYKTIMSESKNIQRR
jgi:chorismate mutase